MKKKKLLKQIHKIRKKIEDKHCSNLNGYLSCTSRCPYYSDITERCIADYIQSAEWSLIAAKNSARGGAE